MQWSIDVYHHVPKIEMAIFQVSPSFRPRDASPVAMAFFSLPAKLLSGERPQAITQG
jgi:hypothetical protein